jgi:hypothetical protein
MIKMLLDLHLHTLAQLEWRGTREGDLDRKHPGIDWPAGIVRAKLAADPGVGDLLDSSLPWSWKTVRDDLYQGALRDPGRVVFIHLGFDVQAVQGTRSAIVRTLGS